MVISLWAMLCGSRWISSSKVFDCWNWSLIVKLENVLFISYLQRENKQNYNQYGQQFWFFRISGIFCIGRNTIFLGCVQLIRLKKVNWSKVKIVQSINLVFSIIWTQKNNLMRKLHSIWEHDTICICNLVPRNQHRWLSYTLFVAKIFLRAQCKVPGTNLLKNKTMPLRFNITLFSLSRFSSNEYIKSTG